MKIRTLVILLLFVLVAAAGFHYIQGSLSKSGAPPAPSRSPSLADAPARLYGLVEPRGREVFVGLGAVGRQVRAGHPPSGSPSHVADRDASDLRTGRSR